KDEAGNAGVGVDGQGLINRVATRLRLDEATIREVYDDQDESLSVVVSPSRLDVKKSEGARELALLVAAGRQAAGLEDWTPHEVIRECCVYYNKFDTNFAANLKALDDDLQVRGSAQKREVRLRAG